MALAADASAAPPTTDFALLEAAFEADAAAASTAPARTDFEELESEDAVTAAPAPALDGAPEGAAPAAPAEEPKMRTSMLKRHVQDHVKILEALLHPPEHAPPAIALPDADPDLWVIDEAGLHASLSSAPARILSQCKKWHDGRRHEIERGDLAGMSPHACVLVLRKLAEEGLVSEAAAQQRVTKTRRRRLSKIVAPPVDYEDSEYAPPSKKVASSWRSECLFEGGKNSIYVGRDLGGLGLGVGFFFEALRVSALVLLVMLLCYVPVLVLNGASNGGYALSPNAIASAGDGGMLKLGLGSQGLDPDAMLKGGCSCTSLSSSGAASECREDGVDCRCNARAGITATSVCKDWRWLRVYGNDIRDLAMTKWVTVASFAAAVALVCGAIAFAARIHGAVATHRREFAEPSEYTVQVNGLPATATIKTIREHFSERYALDEARDAACPTFGVDETGALLALSGRFFIFFSLLFWLLSFDNPAFAAAPFGCTLLAAMVLKHKKVGAPAKRPTPIEAWTSEASAVLAARKRKVPYKVAPDAGESVPVSLQSLDDEAAALCAMYPSGVGPVGDVEHVGGNEEFLGSWVADVQLSHPFGPLITAARSKLKRVAVEDTLKARYQKLKGKGRPTTAVKAKLEKLEAKQAEFFEELRKHDPARVMTTTGTAFVTFENEESALRCLDDYRVSKTWFGRYFQPASLRFCGGARLTIFRAPAPTNIIWENLEQKPSTLFAKRRFSDLFTLLILALAANGVNVASARARAVGRSAPDRIKCQGLPAIYAGTYNVTAPSLVYNESLPCDDNRYHVSYGIEPSIDLELDKFGELETLKRSDAMLEHKGAYGGLQCERDSPTTKICRRKNRLGDYGLFRTTNASTYLTSKSAATCDAPNCGLCDASCVPKDISEDDVDSRCFSLACYGREEQDLAVGWIETKSCFEYHPSLVAQCYCAENLGLKKAWYILTGRTDLAEYELCEDTIKNYFLALVAKLAVAVLVVVINEITRLAIYKLVSIEAHASQTKRLTSLVVKLTISQFVNTALIALAINAQMIDGSDADRRVGEYSREANLLDGLYSGMGKGWYTSVGSALCVTMLLNVIVPQISFVQKVVLAGLKRRVLGPRARTQGQLDALYTPPRWEIERSYAIVLNTLLTTLMYAAGMPLLVLFAAVALGITYAINRVFLFKFVHQPPNFDASLGKNFSNYMLGMAVLHLAMTAYILSENELLHSEVFERFHDAANKDRPAMQKYFLLRIGRKNVLPFFILFAVFLGLLVAWSVLGRPVLTFLAEVMDVLKIRGKTVDLAHVYRHPGFTAAWRSVTFKREKSTTKNARLANATTLYRRWGEDGAAANGADHAAGDIMRSWEVMGTTHIPDYNILSNPEYRDIMKILDEAGFVSLDPEEAITRRPRGAASPTKAASVDIAAAFAGPPPAAPAGGE